VRESDLSAQMARMSPEMAAHVVDALDEGLPHVETISLHLYGGEPLTNLPALEAMVRRAHEKRPARAERARRFSFAITTNGTILSPEILALLDEGAFNVVLSIDGPAHVHDACRRVKALVRDHNAWVILLADDNFAASPRRVRRICDLLGHERLPAFFMVSARGDDLIADPALLPAMARARMLRVCVGVETLDPHTACGVGKPVFLDTYRVAFQRMRELGMFSIASLIVGLPGETPQGRARTVEWLVEAAPDAAQLSPYLPLPGVPLAQGRPGTDPDPDDLRDARAFTAAFYGYPAVRTRLQTAAAGGGVRGLLAQGVLDKHVLVG
jgi:hypothetical protein